MTGSIATFADLIDMAPHGPDVWVGVSDEYPWGRVYGGQVAAQGLWAAAQTVHPEYRAHSLHCYFIRGGESDEPIRFEVDRIRDGRSFETRRVIARQSGGAILNLSASFQRDEDGADVTVPEPPPDVPGPEELERRDWGRLLHRRDVPGREGTRHRTWLRVAGPLGDDPLIHTIAHTFASDDIPMAAVERCHPLGLPDFDEVPAAGEEQQYPYMSASLDHSIWFHRAAPADEWVLHDFRGVGVYGGRGLALGEMWSRDGLHIATVAQEVLLREVRR